MIPTRNRPDKLRGCLAALSEAQKNITFPIYVCDSSPDAAMRERVSEVCREFSTTQLHFHDGKNVAAARNFCAAVAEEPLLVNVDDDVNVQPDAIAALYRRYTASSGWRVVGGSVFWGTFWEGPKVVRRIGYARAALPGEPPSFLIGAFFLYPKRLAELCPWNERIRYSDDIFMGALWRSHGVSIIYEPAARAVHDSAGSTYGVDTCDSLIYANLFDALIANRNLPRAAMYEVLGFAATAKGELGRRGGLRDLMAAWYRGHLQLVRDWGYLSALVNGTLPEMPDRPEQL